MKKICLKIYNFFRKNCPDCYRDPTNGETYCILTLLLFFTLVTTLITFITSNYTTALAQGFLVELHGIIIEFLLFGVLIHIMTKKFLKKQEINNAKDIIETYRNFKSQEASHIHLINMKKLSRSGATHVDLGSCHLAQVDASNLKLQSANFQRATISKAHLNNCKLHETVFNHAQCEGTHFTESNFENGQFEYAVFDDCDLSLASFEGAVLHDCTFYKSILKGTSFQNAKCLNTTFEGCDLEGADFTGTKYLKIEDLLKGKNCSKIIAEDHVIEKINREIRFDNERQH